MIKKILIVDDNIMVRLGMSVLLENKLDGVFIFGVNDFQGALCTCSTIIFDLVILDINLPDGRKTDMIADLREMQNDVKILIFSSYEEEIYTFRYIQAGANGYLNKFNDGAVIIEAIRTVLETGKYISADVLNKFIAFSKEGRDSDNGLEDLTSRELEIAMLLAQGDGNLEV